MKKVILTLSSALLLVLAMPAHAQCKAKQTVKECKSKVDPYIYDSYALNEITFDPGKSLVTEVEFTAFAGQKYKLVFCLSGIDQPLQVNIYDKNKRFKKRNKIYDSSSGVNNQWSFEPPKSGTYYIDYETSAAESKTPKKGCVIMLIGYQE